jgi:hypothetical protein
MLTLKRHRDGVKLKLWHLQEEATGMVFWHLPELTVGIAVDDMGVLMKCLTMGILALSATVTATVALAADYEIFALPLWPGRQG